LTLVLPLFLLFHRYKLPPIWHVVYDKCAELLAANQPVGKATWTAPEIERINEWLPGLITIKPVVYLINISKENFLAGKNKHLPKIKQ
jgi:obg-like ATPase 1